MCIRLQSRKILWLSTALLFAYVVVRTLNLAAFPPFLDEVVHVRQAEQSLESSPVAYAAEGRLFTLWLHMFFHSYQAGTIWLMRAIHILALLPGFAAALTIGHRVAGQTGALLAGFLLLGSPLHIFFERMALADPLAAAWIVVAVLFALGSMQSLSPPNAMACGLALFVAIMFKATAVPALFMLPLAALFLLPAGTGIGARLRWLTLALLPTLLLLLIVVFALRIANQNHFAFITQYMALARTTLVERLVPNLALVAEQFSVYLLPMLLGFLPAFLYLALQGRRGMGQKDNRSGTARRATVFLLLLLLIMLGAYVANERLYTRYLVLPASLFLLVLVAGAAPLVTHLRGRGTRQALAGLICVAMLYPVAFTLLSYGGTTATPLSTADFREYVSSSASGFSLAEVVDVLRQNQPIRVIGILANCQGLRFLADRYFSVECPSTSPSGQDLAALTAMLEQSRLADVFVVHEPLPFVPASVPGRVIASFSRPGSSYALSLYNLTPE